MPRPGRPTYSPGRRTHRPGRRTHRPGRRWRPRPPPSAGSGWRRRCWRTRGRTTRRRRYGCADRWTWKRCGRRWRGWSSATRGSGPCSGATGGPVSSRSSGRGRAARSRCPTPGGRTRTGRSPRCSPRRATGPTTWRRGRCSRPGCCGWPTTTTSWSSACTTSSRTRTRPRCSPATSRSCTRRPAPGARRTSRVPPGRPSAPPSPPPTRPTWPGGGSCWARSRRCWSCTRTGRAAVGWRGAAGRWPGPWAGRRRTGCGSGAGSTG